MKRLFGLTIAVSMLGCGAALAQVSDGVVKLGVLNDMSSLYADASGKGGVLAAQMAVEDFGGKVLGAPIELFPVTIRTSRISVLASRANGSTPIMSMQSSMFRRRPWRWQSRRSRARRSGYS